MPSGHDPVADDLSAVFVADDTDPGRECLPQLSGSDEVVLHPTS